MRPNLRPSSRRPLRPSSRMRPNLRPSSRRPLRPSQKFFTPRFVASKSGAAIAGRLGRPVIQPSVLLSVQRFGRPRRPRAARDVLRLAPRQRSGAPARQPPSRWHQSSTPLGSQRYAKVWSFPIRPIRRSQFASILHDVTVGMRKLSAQAPPCMHTTKLITPRQAIRFASSNPVRSRASSAGAL